MGTLASRAAAARGRAVGSAFALLLWAMILGIGGFATGPSLAAEGAVTADELGDLLETIEDETERRKFADRLRALIAASDEEKSVERPGGGGRGSSPVFRRGSATPETNWWPSPEA